MDSLTEAQIRSIKKSYLNILGFFLSEQKIESRFMRCMLKWGFQLHLSADDLAHANVDISDLVFSDPDEKVARVEAIFHLVHMICLDRVVEDVELEVASRYAEKLGFKDSLVRELFQSLATLDSDEFAPGNVRQQVMDFLKVYEDQ